MTKTDFDKNIGKILESYKSLIEYCRMEELLSDDYYFVTHIQTLKIENET